MLKIKAKSRDMLRIWVLVWAANKRADFLLGKTDKVARQVNALLEKLENMWGITEAELYNRDESKKRAIELTKDVGKRQGALENMKIWDSRY